MPQSGTETMTLTTNQGKITVAIDVAKVPCAAASFSYLAGKHFFDNTSCYGCTAAGTSSCSAATVRHRYRRPSYSYSPENLPADNRPTYVTGMVAIGAPPTAGKTASQFFIVYKNTEDDPSQTTTPTSILPGQFTVLGSVTAGMEVRTEGGRRRAHRGRQDRPEHRQAEDPADDRLADGGRGGLGGAVKLRCLQAPEVTRYAS